MIIPQWNGRYTLLLPSKLKNISRDLKITMTPIRRILLISVALAFAGCATPTKPNIPYSVPIPQLDKIELRNPLLATELRKLPEIQDGVSPLETSALEKIVEIYDRFPDKFNKAFEQMYQVGKPDVRKYCSPLQTLFWLVEDENISLCNQAINEYYLKILLDNGWTTEKFGIKEYGLSVKDLKNHKKRWDDFITVTNRLNAPQLIDYYEKNNFNYELYMGDRKTNKGVFLSKNANCADTSDFTVYCLQKAGYKAGHVKVDSKTCARGHIITFYKDKGKLFIMDNGTSCPKGIMGPYNSFREIPYSIIEIRNVF